MAWGLAVRLNFNAINGRVKTTVDRWYNYLLVTVLVLLHLLFIKLFANALLEHVVVRAYCMPYRHPGLLEMTRNRSGTN